MLATTNKSTPKMPTINSLTGLRGVAALWVVVYHVWVGMGRQKITFYGANITPFFLGEFGVDIFFVLSGFVVFLPCAFALHHNLKISWQAFYLRRVARLFPAYHLQLSFMFLLFVSGLYFQDASAINAIQHIFLLQNIPPENSTSILGVYWTLPVEFNFYLSIPILLFLIKRFGVAKATLCIMISCMAYRYYIFEIYNTAEYWTMFIKLNQLIGRLDEFLVGILLAIFYTRFRGNNHLIEKIKNAELPIIISGFLGIMSCVYYYEIGEMEKYYYEGGLPLFLFDTALATSIGILILALSTQGKLGNAIFANRFIVFLGTISYGIYLWHPLVFTILIDHLPIMTKLNFIQEAMIGIITTILVASASYFTIELPIMNFAKRKSPSIWLENK